MRAIVHVDMDAFYASVEQRDDPALQGKPVIVGGHAQRGVVLAASYEVRPFGVRSAMPMARALKLAPHALVVRPRFSAYGEASEQVFAIFERYTPLVEPLSLDEAFLDVTASEGLFGAPAEIARRIRNEIANELSLPASAGIAAVKFVAKIASELAKPNGQREIRADETVTFLARAAVVPAVGRGPQDRGGAHARGAQHDRRRRGAGRVVAGGAPWIAGAAPVGPRPRSRSARGRPGPRAPRASAPRIPSRRI